MFKLLESTAGRIILSIILGFGLATIFKTACKNNSCIVVKGPKTDETNKYYYKIDSDCYKYTPVAAKCDGETSV